MVIKVYFGQHCPLTKININYYFILLQVNVDEKVVIRSLKVTSFVIKILIKVVNILKHAANKNNEHLIETLIYVYQ